MASPLPLKCDLCQKPAKVHLTQIVADKVKKMDLCESCAQANGVTDPTGFPLADLLFNAAHPPAGLGLRCESCGFTQAEFKKQGRFGCAQCYDAFSDMLPALLEGMHKGTAHVGKVPHRALERKNLSDRLQRLESNLDLAIKAERYEDAARFRDEIHQVKQGTLPAGPIA